MFAGLTMPIGPGLARFRIGMMISAQPELNVPITPITLLLPTYAFAFVEHLPESHFPACAVESSQDWKPTVYLPALKFCCLKMNLIAFTICSVCVRPDPWSGRSEATMNCGSSLPL